MKKLLLKCTGLLARLVTIAHMLLTYVLLFGYIYANYPRDLSMGHHYLILFSLIFLYIGVSTIDAAIHEAGHLVFGLLTGYRFVFYRVMSIMVLRRGGRLHICRHSLRGTGGQCAMSPPEPVDGKFPVMLFNLGGCVFNLLGAAGWFGILLLVAGHQLGMLLALWGIVDSLTGALVNGLPLKTKTVTNDGYNAVSLGNDPEALKSFHTQMRYMELLVEGVRLRDMPEEWFYMPDPERMKSRILSFHGAALVSRELDRGDHDAALAVLDTLLSVESGLPEASLGLYELERAYLLLLKGERPELSKRAKQARKLFARSLTTQRFEYAWWTLAEKNARKARQARRNFGRIARHYPYPGDLASELEALDRVDEMAANCAG